MNGSKSPDVAAKATDAGKAPATTNGQVKATHGSPTRSLRSDKQSTSESQTTKQDQSTSGNSTQLNGVEEDAASEAETLITSPVKKREAAKQASVVKTEKPLRSRIGGLPVPAEDDEDSIASPLPSTEVSADKTAGGGDTKVGDTGIPDEEGDADNVSDLSSARSSVSRTSSMSRAMSERPNPARRGVSPNPRKRKYRASSVGLPNSKRQSMEPPRTKRKEGAVESEGTNHTAERSTSPKLRSHRRAVSTHSALDSALDGTNKKRRAPAQFPVRESKVVKSEWVESDASSETTSRGGDEARRPQRQVGRSTSTPGRPSQREHKRHVNKYGFTRLAEACEDGNLDAVKEWRVKDPDQVELAEFAGNKPLQIAALNGNSEVVDYLIQEGCQIDCANADKDTPLIDAAENGHLEVVKLLLNAGVDPLRQNLKGQQALDVVTDDVDDAKQIRAALRSAINRWNSDDAKQRREEEEEQRHRGGPSKELHFMARTYENLLKLVTINDRTGVQEFLDARVPVDNTIVAAAAKTGDSYLLNMLLAEMTEKKASQKPEKPMLAVLGTSHFDMVKLLTELDQFNPLWESRQGKTWPEIAVERNGPKWRQERELLQRLYDEHAGSKERRSSSPVSKRDANGKRRALHPHSDESDDDGDQASTNAKRKNGRRLMSRKDMRAAGGKGVSDSSDDAGDDSDNTGVPTEEERLGKDGAESAMPPPETPNTRSAAGRTRSQSTSSQPSDISPRTRRRSITLRGDQVLPTVEESSELSQDRTERDGDADKKAKEEAAAEVERKKEDERIQADARKAEEDARRIEEKRKADEQRAADEQRRRKEEQKAEEARQQAEALAAEEARKAEEERVRKEKELEESKQLLQADILACLPPALREVLDPDSPYCLDSPINNNEVIARSTFSTLEHFTPLRLVSAVTDEASPTMSDPSRWVLNLQAAPMLGKRGLELFLAPDTVHYADSLANRLVTAPVAPKDKFVIDQILAGMPPTAAANDGDDDEMQIDEDTTNGELHRSPSKPAERYTTFVSARQRLNAASCPAIIRCVNLDDVLGHLHPRLQGHDLTISGFDTHAFIDSLPPKVENDAEEHLDFVGRLQSVWDRRRTMKLIGTAEVRNEPLADATSCVCMADVVIVHEK